MLVAAIVGAELRARAGEEAHADGWRRTANGWERHEDWYMESLRAAYPRRDYFTSDQQREPSAARWDFHPAVLVAIQGLAIAVGFGLWARRPSESSVWSAADGGENSLSKRDRRGRAA